MADISLVTSADEPLEKASNIVILAEKDLVSYPPPEQSSCAPKEATKVLAAEKQEMVLHESVTSLGKRASVYVILLIDMLLRD